MTFSSCSCTNFFCFSAFPITRHFGPLLFSPFMLIVMFEAVVWSDRWLVDFCYITPNRALTDSSLDPLLSSSSIQVTVTSSLPLPLFIFVIILWLLTLFPLLIFGPSRHPPCFPSHSINPTPLMLGGHMLVDYMYTLVSINRYLHMNAELVREEKILVSEAFRFL